MDINHPRLHSTGEQTIIEINNNPFTIGRGLHCDYIIPNQVISRLHCQFEKNGNQWFLRDSSTNGTIINGRLIRASLSSPLNESDVIQLAPDNFKYVFQSGPIDDISDEQLCMIADSALENIATVISPAPVSNTTSSDSIVHISDASSDLVVQPQSPSVSTVGTRPKKRIKVTSVIDLTDDSSSVQYEGPSTSTNRGPPELTVDLSNSCQSLPSSSTDLKMVIQKVSTTQGPSIVKTETASSSTDMGQTESQSPDAESKEQVNEMDDELLCAVCSEMFVKASTLNCSHTFCKLCIDTWKQKQSCCPICRAKITSQVGTLVLDNVIEKVVQSSSKEVQDHRKELLEERNKLNQSKQPKPRAPVGHYGVRGRDHSERETVDVSSDASTLSESSDLDDDWETEYWNDDWYDRQQGAGPGRGRYYGGYGRCFSCGGSGHWANGCPHR